MIMDWTFEKEAMERGYRAVCGIDEAGRGPLAGPVVAAAVILPFGLKIEGLNDSKKLTEKKRETLYDIICREAVAYSIASVDHQIIDEINILQATFLAMKNAVEGLQIPADYALVDGNRSQGLEIPFECVIGGDANVPSIAAASVLAKVTRDRYMLQMAEEYPQYLFEKHKGYGTKAHYTAIDVYGTCMIHRQSFLKKYYEKKARSRQMRTRGETGHRGEECAAQMLERSGYTILERNYRIRQGEIDLIARKDGFLVFAEVKTRSDTHVAQAREFVTSAKQRKLIETAAAWLQLHDLPLQPRFDVIEVYWKKNAQKPDRICHLENAFEA